jgi:hypothetical protein
LLRETQVSHALPCGNPGASSEEFKRLKITE